MPWATERPIRRDGAISSEAPTASNPSNDADAAADDVDADNCVATVLADNESAAGKDDIAGAAEA